MYRTRPTIQNLPRDTDFQLISVQNNQAVYSISQLNQLMLITYIQIPKTTFGPIMISLVSLLNRV